MSKKTLDFSTTPIRGFMPSPRLRCDKCLSEAILDSSISSGDIDMLIPGYNLVITDHPASIKGGDVCIYFSKISVFEKIEKKFKL